MIKPVYVNDEEKELFERKLGDKLNFLNMSYSEFVREAVLHGDMVVSTALPDYYARESRKSPAKYIVLAVRKDET